MKIPKKILVPIDMSDYSIAALTSASEIAELFKAEVNVMNVVDVGDVEAELPPEVLGSKEIKLLMERKRRAKVDRLLKSKKHPGMTGKRLVIRVGDPAREIVRYAGETGIDLIVMSTHGRSGLKHIILGSVAEKVVRYARCAVLTIKPEEFWEVVDIREEDVAGDLRIPKK